MAMSGKVAAGPVLMIVGLASALYGFNYMNSFGSQMARTVGMSDSTGVICIVAGGLLFFLGLWLCIDGAADGGTRSESPRRGGPSSVTDLGGEVYFCIDCNTPVGAGTLKCPGCGRALGVVGEEASRSSVQGINTKRCPDCAEEVKAEARKCRFSGFVFPA